MPGLTFVFVGKMRERYYIDAFEEYYKRLGAFTKPELREIAEERLPEQPSEKEISQALGREAGEILKAVPRGAYTVALCVEGRAMSSEELALAIEGKPKLCFMGCPHMTLHQLIDTTERVEAGLRAHGQRKVCIPTVFTAAPGVIEEFEKTEYAPRLRNTGVVLSYICPLMYMNNPLSKAMPVITSSNKLRTYTTARYYTEEEIITMITKGAN